MATKNTETTGQELVAKYSSQIHGKVVLATGVSPGGLGAHFLQAIAAGKPKLIILAGRDAQKCRVTADSIIAEYPGIKTKILALDLSSLANVRAAAQEVLTWLDVPFIDILVNNAGIMATPFSLSTDGYESQFASNHLGHFLFTNLIMPKILASLTPRVVTVSSGGHRYGGVRFSDINFDVCKLSSVLFTCVYQLTLFCYLRMGPFTRNGLHTASPRRPIFFLQSLSLKSLAGAAFCLSVFIQGSL